MLGETFVAMYLDNHFLPQGAVSCCILLRPSRPLQLIAGFATACRKFEAAKRQRSTLQDRSCRYQGSSPFRRSKVQEAVLSWGRFNIINHIKDLRREEFLVFGESYLLTD